jgi:hypothetical protein
MQAVSALNEAMIDGNIRTLHQVWPVFAFQRGEELLVESLRLFIGHRQMKIRLIALEYCIKSELKTE